MLPDLHHEFDETPNTMGGPLVEHALRRRTLDSTQLAVGLLPTLLGQLISTPRTAAVKALQGLAPLSLESGHLYPADRRG